MVPLPRSGYDPIPDVTESNGDISSKKSPQELYPEANQEEAELLVLLDEIIKDPTVRVQLPLVTVDDVGISSTIGGFLCSMTIPTIALVLATAGAVWVRTATVPETISPYIQYFPYATALVGFLASSIPIQNRFKQQALKVSSLLTTTRPVAISTVENVVISVASKIDLVNMRLNLVVDAMRPKFGRARQAEKELKSMDPNLEIPDPRSVERELEGAKDEIDESIKFVEKDFQVTPWIPGHLLLARSRASYITLFCFLVLQFAGVYVLLQYFYPMQVLAPSPKNSGLLRDMTIRLRSIFSSGNIKAEGLSMYEDLSVLVASAWPSPIVFVVEVYAMTFFHVAIAFRMTSSSATAATVNQTRISVSEKTEYLLRQHGIIFLCRDILELRTGRVRMKLLKMISQLYKIEMLMTMTETNHSPSSVKQSSPKRSPTSPTGRRISRFFSSSSAKDFYSSP